MTGWVIVWVVVYLVYQGSTQVNDRYVQYRVFANLFNIDDVPVSTPERKEPAQLSVPGPPSQSQCFIFKIRITNLAL